MVRVSREQSIKHEEFWELIPAFAIVVFDNDERPAFEAHLRDCDECRTLRIEYRAVSDGLLHAMVPMAAPSGPQSDLRRRIALRAPVKPRSSCNDRLLRPAFGLALVDLEVELASRPQLILGGTSHPD